MPSYWLYKSEPSVYSIEDMRRDRRTGWDGVRNYLARNNLRAARPGDLALFYHSNADPTGVAGIARVVEPAHADPTQFDRRSGQYDAKATRDAPRWDQVTVEFVEAFPAVLPLDALRSDRRLEGMMLLGPQGSRLSVQPVEPSHFDRIVATARGIATPVARSR